MLSPELCDEVASGSTADIEYKIAGNLEERASACRLVHDSYVRAGLGEPNPYRARVTPWHLLPTTEVFIAVLRSETFFTLSLVIDGALGLPMDSVYGDIVARQREAGRRVAEISCLADRRRDFRGVSPIFRSLGRLAMQYAWARGVEQVLIAVHPRHARLYARVAGFRPIGEQRIYPSVRNRPAVALCLDLERIQRERGDAYDLFFGVPVPAEQLEPRPITRAERDFFRVMMDPCFRLAPVADEGDGASGRAAWGGRFAPAPAGAWRAGAPAMQPG